VLLKTQLQGQVTHFLIEHVKQIGSEENQYEYHHRVNGLPTFGDVAT
jgi:hypothetical protein